MINITKVAPVQLSVFVVRAGIEPAMITPSPHNNLSKS